MSMRLRLLFPLFTFRSGTLPWAVALTVFATIFAFMSLSASAAARSWSTSGSGEKIVLTDCRDCGDDIGMMVVCRGAERPAMVTVHWAAVATGQEGATLPMVLNIDGQNFNRQAVTRYFGQIGYTPEFEMDRNDALIAALQSGRSLKISFGGQTTELALQGSHDAFESFKTHCGWNPTTPPGNDAKWFVQTYSSADSGQPKTFLTFGIPETDAIAFSARCESGQGGPELMVDLLIDSGDIAPSQPIDVNWQGPNLKATYAGKVFKDSSEYAGVRLAIGIDDPLWQVFSKTGELVLQAKNLAPVTIPLQGAERPVQDFLKTCRAYFAAFDAAATPEQDNVYLYDCEDGSKLRARYDNSRSYSVAHVSHAGQTEVALIQVVSGSGVKYSNGDLTLHTKAGDALLIDGETVHRCHSE